MPQGTNKGKSTLGTYTYQTSKFMKQKKINQNLYELIKLNPLKKQIGS